MLNLLSRLDNVVLISSSLRSMVSSLFRIRSNFDSKASDCISKTSVERSGEELEFNSLALFSTGEAPDALELLLSLAFRLEFIRIKGRKTSFSDEVMWSSLEHVYCLRMPLTPSNGKHDLHPQKSTLPNSIWKQWTKGHSVEMPLQNSNVFNH